MKGIKQNENYFSFDSWMMPKVDCRDKISIHIMRFALVSETPWA